MSASGHPVLRKNEQTTSINLSALMTFFWTLRHRQDYGIVPKGAEEDAHQWESDIFLAFSSALMYLILSENLYKRNKS